MKRPTRNTEKSILDESPQEAAQRRSEEVDAILNSPRPQTVNMKTAGTFTFRDGRGFPTRIKNSGEEYLKEEAELNKHRWNAKKLSKSVRENSDKRIGSDFLHRDPQTWSYRK